MLRVRFTVGDTITASVAIYKQNWRQYLKLSFIAHLWLLVPIYGWARYFAIAAWKRSNSRSDCQYIYRFHKSIFRNYFIVNSIFLKKFILLCKLTN